MLVVVVAVHRGHVDITSAWPPRHRVRSVLVDRRCLPDPGDQRPGLDCQHVVHVPERPHIAGRAAAPGPVPRAVHLGKERDRDRVAERPDRLPELPQPRVGAAGACGDLAGPAAERAWLELQDGLGTPADRCGDELGEVGDRGSPVHVCDRQGGAAALRVEFRQRLAAGVDAEQQSLGERPEYLRRRGCASNGRDRGGPARS